MGIAKPSRTAYPRVSQKSGEPQCTVVNVCSEPRTWPALFFDLYSRGYAHRIVGSGPSCAEGAQPSARAQGSVVPPPPRTGSTVCGRRVRVRTASGEWVSTAVGERRPAEENARFPLERSAHPGHVVARGCVQHQAAGAPDRRASPAPSTSPWSRRHPHLPPTAHSRVVAAFAEAAPAFGAASAAATARRSQRRLLRRVHPGRPPLPPKAGAPRTGHHSSLRRRATAAGALPRPQGCAHRGKAVRRLRTRRRPPTAAHRHRRRAARGGCAGPAPAAACPELRDDRPARVIPALPDERGPVGAPSRKLEARRRAKELGRPLDVKRRRQQQQAVAVA
eukprot:5948324-Prymnesium_polylepis.1